MKLFFVVASLLLAFSAQANDRKVGNVIAVERTISNVYNSCISTIDEADTVKPKTFFSCAIKFTQDGELPVTKGRVLNLRDNRCLVEGESVNGMLFITFSAAKGLTPFEVAKGCLQKSLGSRDSVKVVLYTLE
ncbi:hypothetical protein [Bdellovibrio reynosensis]|uniref:Uncharacterized protein n=1 Tax=Bdellovibrio reynosensis TaxID=2835041 RepID=A0ABY4C834_9BACT|nr:hypothetical protein [Bdellovibrio reynosensis]UOE99835.1 hypothetical protein MNR06_09015 [Bdellovibrio reynosensis]